MEAGRYIEVLDPYDWLPEYGETSISLLRQGEDLIVSMKYDGPEGDAIKNLRFDFACEFLESSFPGPTASSGLTYSFRCDVPISALVEYPDSEGAAAWTKYFQNTHKIKHYRIIFTASNQIVMIYAKNCEVME